MVSIESARYCSNSCMVLLNKSVVFEKLVHFLYMLLPCTVDDYGM
jgi:hypothetical protein